VYLQSIPENSELDKLMKRSELKPSDIVHNFELFFNMLYFCGKHEERSYPIFSRIRRAPSKESAEQRSFTKADLGSR